LSTPTRLIRTVVKRLERLERIRAIMNDAFVFTGDRKDRFRRDIVTALVAEELKEEVSPRLRATIIALGKQLGWRPLMNGNRALFCCVKARA
jgi:hypothetical protein